MVSDCAIIEGLNYSERIKKEGGVIMSKEAKRLTEMTKSGG